MPDRIVLHIGTHKTGTTAIQWSLADAGPSLLKRGVLYPEAGRMGPGHAFLASEVIGAPADRPVEAQLLAEVRGSGVPTVVLSSEVFSQPVHASAFVAWSASFVSELAARDLKVVAYARPQGEYLESLYVQRVRAGLVWCSFEEFVDRCLTEGERFEYPNVLGPWRDAFGDCLEARPYSARLEVDVVDDFWRAAELGRPAVRRPGRSNPRIGGRTTEMLRALRALLAEQGLDEVSPPRKVLGRARGRIEAGIGRDRPFSGLTPDLAARVDARFALSNEELVRDHFHGRHATVFRGSTVHSTAVGAWSLSDAGKEERRLFDEVAEETLRELRALSDDPEGAPIPPGRPPAARGRGPW